MTGFDECARTLGISRAQLRRDLREGAPQARRGRKGNGGAAMLDPTLIAAWRATRAGTAGVDEVLRTLGGEIPELIATELWMQYRGVEGPHKQATGREFQQAWGRITMAIVGRIRQHVPIPDVTAIPPAIIQMFKR